MNFSKLKQSLLYIIGAIVIGVVSNAVWEFLAKPAVFSVQDTILNLSTLGIKQFKDTMYVEIARGTQNRASLALLGQFVGIYSGALVVISMISFVALKAVKTRYRSLLERLEDSDEKGSTKPPRKEELLLQLKELRPGIRHLDRVVLGGALAVLPLVVFIFITGERISYTDNAVSHFEQSLAVVLPYIDSGKEKAFRSAFAQIATKEDYERIILTLRSIAQSNGQRHPHFDIW